MLMVTRDRQASKSTKNTIKHQEVIFIDFLEEKTKIQVVILKSLLDKHDHHSFSMEIADWTCFK